VCVFPGWPSECSKANNEGQFAFRLLGLLLMDCWLALCDDDRFDDLFNFASSDMFKMDRSKQLQWIYGPGGKHQVQMVISQLATPCTHMS
jgi:hypothetical protein